MSRLSKEPGDILVFGRTAGMRYVDGRDDATDDATEEDISQQPCLQFVYWQSSMFLEGPLQSLVEPSRPLS
jgi:hypothetical protein